MWSKQTGNFCSALFYRLLLLSETENLIDPEGNCFFMTVQTQRQKNIKSKQIQLNSRKYFTLMLYAIHTNAGVLKTIDK